MPTAPDPITEDHVDDMSYGAVYLAGYHDGYLAAVNAVMIEARRRYKRLDEASLRMVTWIADAVMAEVVGDE